MSLRDKLRELETNLPVTCTSDSVSRPIRILRLIRRWETHIKLQRADAGS